MAGYSKAYQTVTAGRVREDEAISFYGNNKVAVPDRTVNFASIGGQTQPTVKVDYLNDPNIAKPGATKDPLKDAWNLPGQNVGL